MAGDIHVAVLGAGIRGAAAAAFLAASRIAKVTIVECATPGGGASSRNHGRFHSGTWNYLINSEENIHSFRESRKIAEQIGQIWECDNIGLYCIESPACISSFSDKFPELEIFISGHSTETMFWLGRQPAAVFQMPEYSFNPAAIARKLVSYSIETGRCEFIRARAKSVKSHGQSQVVVCDGGETIKADIVIDALGGWSAKVMWDDDKITSNFVFNRWRLLCFNTQDIEYPRLSRVLTFERARNPTEVAPGPLGAVPHGQWVILGCDTQPELVGSQDDEDPSRGWRLFDDSNRQDNAVYTAHRDYFPSIDRARKYDALYSFSGIYAEIAGAGSERRQKTGAPTPYRVKSDFRRNESKMRYNLVGGSATTSFVDAKNVIEDIYERVVEKKIDFEAAIFDLSRFFQSKFSSEGMAWEHRQRRIGHDAALAPAS